MKSVKIKPLTWITAKWDDSDQSTIVFARSCFAANGQFVITKNIHSWVGNWSTDKILRFKTLEDAKRSAEKYHTEMVNTLIEEVDDHVVIPINNPVTQKNLDDMFEATRKTSNLDEIFIAGVKSLIDTYR